MRAAVFHEAGRPLSIETVADPTPAPDQVVIEVAGAGICGSDLHMTQFPGYAAPGLILGHEYAGTIVAVGSDVGGGWKLGDRVTSMPLFSCEGCEACDADLPALCPNGRFAGTTLETPGAYAQFIAARGVYLQKLPAGVSFSEGAMVEPLAVAHHTVERAGLRGGEAVLILGGGPIGAAVALFARAGGAAHVVVSEPFPARRDSAPAAGATGVIDPKNEDVAGAFARIAGKRPDVVFECVGVPGMLHQAVELAGLRGRVIVTGVLMAERDTLPPLTAFAKEVSVIYSQCYSERTFETVIDMIATGKADPKPLHTATIGLDALPETFEALRSASPHCKVLIDPSL